MSAPLTSPHPEGLRLDFDKLAPAFLSQGFVEVRAVDYVQALPIYAEHAARYQAWIATKKHGDMAYLERGLDRRMDPRLVFPELKSVITVALPYSPHPIEANGLRYARYLNGTDYHDSMKVKLEAAMQNLIAEKKVPANFAYKNCVDTSAVLERSWAVISGLGWVGKNTLLIHPQHGSFIFLGVIFTNAEFGLAPHLLKDYCGSCTRCISACPTEALKSHQLDANTCISYLTLEKRGAWEKPYKTAGFLAGCDLCQEVCPYNTKAVKNRPVEIVGPHLQLDPEVMLAEDESAYKARVQGTSLSRVKYADFRRNLLSAMGSLRSPNPVKNKRIF